jgi:hypothetical protein
LQLQQSLKNSIVTLSPGSTQGSGQETRTSVMIGQLVEIDGVGHP